MSQRNVTLGLALTFAIGAVPAPADTSVPMIPREAIFGNPAATGVALSPDGRTISWLAPLDGVMNVWVAPADDPDAARALTRETGRGIAGAVWAPDSSHVLYIQDSGGNENFRVYAIPAAGGEGRDLMPNDGKATIQIRGISRFRPDVILIGINDRDPRYFDLYEVDYRTGTKTLVAENPGYANWITDTMLRPRFASKSTPEGDVVYARRTAGGRWADAFTVPVDDALVTGPRGFSRDGHTLYWLDSRGRDRAAFVAMDAETLDTRVIAQDDRADIGAVLRDPETLEPIAYSANYLRNRWTGLDARTRERLAFLERELPGDPQIAGMSNDGRRALVVASAAETPGATYLYDMEANRLTKLFDTRPALAGTPLQPMWPVEVQSGDGLTLVSYLTLPAGADANRDGRADRPVPMVLYVHGGPWARDSYGYNATHQWLANRDYAVLSVNYRGSTGFGKDFLNAAVHQFSGKMHSDLIDAVDWAIAQGVTTRDQVAIMGGSYGGYATLVGVTFTPDRFACGVDIVGPSNLATMISTFPAYWRPQLADSWFKHVGDPDVPADRERMLGWSPITRVEAIRVPLLIGQGGNDPRIVKAESDQMVAAMRERNLPVTYVNFPDEGHGFARAPNRLAFNAVAESFLGQCLGGRSEPIGTAFQGSSVQVLEGAEHVPGLAAALPANATE